MHFAFPTEIAVKKRFKLSPTSVSNDTLQTSRLLFVLLLFFYRFFCTIIQYSRVEQEMKKSAGYTSLSIRA